MLCMLEPGTSWLPDQLKVGEEEKAREFQTDKEDMTELKSVQRKAEQAPERERE